MKTSFKALYAVSLMALLAAVPMRSNAQLFEDGEVRREFLKLRKQVEDITSRLDSRLVPLNARIDGKADIKSTIDLASEIEKLRVDLANLRGQIEVLSNDQLNSQRRQKDFYADLDQRLRKLEPQRLSVEGIEVEVNQPEQKAFDVALDLFKAGNYLAADQALNSFLHRYPDSVYVAQATYWLANTYFAQSDYAKAIPAYRTVAERFPASFKAPDALLNLASCQLDLKNTAAARETMETLIKKYPTSSAAEMAKERLAEIN